MYQSISNLTTLRTTPVDSHVSIARGVGISPNFFAQVIGFPIREIFCSFERKMQEFLDLFQRN